MASLPGGVGEKLRRTGVEVTATLNSLSSININPSLQVFELCGERGFDAKHSTGEQGLDHGWGAPCFDPSGE